MSFLAWIVLLIVALLAGALGLLFGRLAAARTRAQADAAEGERTRLVRELREAQTELVAMRGELGAVQTDRASAQAGLAALERQLEALKAEASGVERVLEEKLGKLREEAAELASERARLQAELRAERAAGQERLEAARRADEERRAFVAAAQADMANQFEKVAAGILEDKSKRFTDHNKANLEQLLQPLREKLGEFQGKVEGMQADGLVGRTELKAQIESLRGLNEKLSTDANNLVKALKNSSKQQGDWGEVLLVGMLEDAGLRAGHEYRVQTSYANEEGRQSRPDIILNLPDAKHLVIDSKVSLSSYTEYCSCEDDQARKGFLDRHAVSVRNHIESLNLKSYQGLHQLNSLDFVMMFMPIEPAYLLALAHDPGLWQRAWNKNVLLVSPGTLFPVIRTIAHMWQQEKQSKNVEEILRQAGGLYDKVAGFAESFEKVGKQLETARTAYDNSFKQLSSGTGNVIGRVTKLRELGVKTTKKMPGVFAGDTELEQGEGLPALLPEASESTEG